MFKVVFKVQCHFMLTATFYKYLDLIIVICRVLAYILLKYLMCLLSVICFGNCYSKFSSRHNLLAKINSVLLITMMT